MTEYVVVVDGKEVAVFWPDNDAKAVELFNAETWPEGAMLYAVQETYRQILPKSTSTWEPKSLVIHD